MSSVSTSRTDPSTRHDLPPIHLVCERLQSPQPLANYAFQTDFGTTTSKTSIGINSGDTYITIQQGNANIVSSISNTGGGNPYMPPYYVLAFIMRIV